MKYLITGLIISFLLPLCVAGQVNLVANGSFENMINCPSGQGQITNASGWQSYNAGSPDYFNACATTFGVPTNTYGTQAAAHGSAYCAIITHIDYNNFEYITKGMTAMQPGLMYEISMSVSRGDNSTLATDNLGVFLSTSASVVSTATLLTIQPQIHYGSYGVITDTANWVRVRKPFLADSAYNNIVIGGFNNSQSTYNIDTTKTATSNMVIYYIDSVVVTLLDSLWFNFDDNTLCAGDTITVPYFTIKDKQPNNVFTLQLSNATGAFSSPINIGSIASDTSDTITAVIPINLPTGTDYRLRIITSNAPDTSMEGIALKIAAPIAKPVADNDGPYCIADTVKLTTTSATTGVTYSWAGPAGFAANTQNPTITSALVGNTGNYIVTTTLYGCQAKDTTAVVVNVGPTGTLATTNAPVCADDTMKLFGIADGTGISYSWKGPNNFTANTQNVVIPVSTISMSGIYELHAFNGNCTSVDIVSANVKPRPAGFSATSNSPVCAGQNINFTGNTTSTGVVFSWAGPNGFNTTGAAPFIGGTGTIHSGDYYVTASLNGCPLKDTLTVLVKPLPVKPVAAANTPLCAGETLSLTATTTTTGVSYSWAGPNSFTSTTQNPAISNSTVAMAGDYIVTVAKDGCIQADTATVQVRPMPAAVTTGNNGPICAGSSLQLTVSSSTTGSTYSWAGPNSFSATTQAATVTGATTAATGWYVHTVNLNGCLYKDSTYATVKTMPVTPAASYNNPLCVGETLTLTGAGTAGSSYAWEGPNGFVNNQQNPTRSSMQYADTGLYKVTTTLNGCTSPQGSVRVAINAPPFVVISANPADSICKGAPIVFTALSSNHGGTPQYQWFINNTAVTTGTVFNTTAIAHGDVIRCDMTEYTKCSSPYTDASNDVTITVLPVLAPAVTFTANPNRPLSANEYVTFTAAATNAGASPTFQWKRNGQNVQGATGAVWGANTLADNDSISVEVISSYKCSSPATASANGIRVKVLSAVGNVNSMGTLAVYPNPNTGRFVLKSSSHLKGNIKVISSVGQVVYQAIANGTTQQEIDLNHIAAGIYILTVQDENGNGIVRLNIQ